MWLWKKKVQDPCRATLKLATRPFREKNAWPPHGNAAEDRASADVSRRSHGSWLAAVDEMQSGF
jgi:hypothetical protein